MVEDDETVRNVAVRILKSLGYQIRVAEDGQEAVEKFEQECEKINLVLMDVVLPKARGPEAYEKMQAIKPEIPVIFVSGFDVKSEIANLNISANTPVEVLQKPFTKDALAQKLQLFLAD